MTGAPIRALFVVPLLKAGGAERHLTTLLPRMDATRFMPSVVCLGGEGELFADLRAAGITAEALNLRKSQAVRALRELLTIIRRQRPDVVVASGYNAETLGRVAARLAGVQHTVVWVHNASEITPRGPVQRSVDRALIRWTSAYFGVANVQRDFLVHERGYPADRIRIIHNGVDPQLFDTAGDRRVLHELGFDMDGPVVGILGSLRPEKDHATFLRAARIVTDAMPQARFLIIGDGVCRPELEKLCVTLGISRNVRFTGARHDVAQMLSTLDVFALTSTTECLPMALLEAMACARPAVCTAVGGVSEVVTDGVTGYLVPPKDPEQLAGRLLRLLGDPVAARVMGRAGRRRVETAFELDRSVEAAQWAMEDLVSNRHTEVGGVIA